ncbi:MAG: DNA alkylation repair protein [Rothia sp. (in: high G+C Gram-positive bacteria)]|nr:DNA alkylation repair protein [Rothia sp. (in: high G+C Gram-positive bacteria)]
MNISEYEQSMLDAADSGIAAGMSAYMRDQFSFLGLKSPARREIFKPYLAELKAEAKKSQSVDREFVEHAWAQTGREFLYNALDYLAAVKKYLEPSDIPWLRSLAERKTWWCSIDRLDRIIGDVALRHPDVEAILVNDWATDSNFWIRRIAIDHQLSRKDKTRPEVLEAVITQNFGSREFFINKAIGWSLRDYSKTNPQWVRDFLQKYSSQMAPLSIREASKYV